MKTLILYATRHGSTAEAARRIAARMPNSDVKNIKTDAFRLADYDRILIGSYIRMGMFDRKIRALLLKEIAVLREKMLGIFVCCCFTENAQTYFQNNVPPQLLETVQATAALGGELDRKKLHGMDKYVANMVLKADHARGILHTFTLKEENIEAFVNKMQM
ncbi:MAG: flavodoxin domain-containing protein [Lachnospiraceae bacterium]